MTALVTGAAGFLGGHLVDRLLEMGETVIGVDNLRRGTEDRLAPHRNNNRLRFHIADVRERGALDTLLAGCDIVYHLAAQSNVMGAFDDLDYSFDTNVEGTYNLLKSAQSANVAHFVFSSSREVYGEPRTLPVAEGSPTEPKNPYGASKLAGEALCRAWQETLHLPCTILRFGNIYGPGDKDRVIPIWVERAQHGDDLVLYGGTQVLDFLWVGAAVEALIRAGTFPHLGPINVASGKGTSLLELAEAISAIAATKSTIRMEPARPAEVTQFVADVRRMKALLKLESEPQPLAHLPELFEPAGRRTE